MPGSGHWRSHIPPHLPPHPHREDTVRWLLPVLTSRSSLVSLYRHSGIDVFHRLLRFQKDPGQSAPATGAAEMVSHPISLLCVIVMGSGEHEGRRCVLKIHQHPPPSSSFSISSSSSLFSPPTILLRADGVRPNCSQNFSIIFILVWAMDTCGTCCR